MATASLIIDNRKNTQRVDGAYPIKIKVEHRGKHLVINLKMYSQLEYWAGETLVKGNLRFLSNQFPNSNRANTALGKYIITAREIIEDYEKEIKDWTCEQVRDLIKHKILGDKLEKRKKLKKDDPEIIPKSANSIALFPYADNLIKRSIDAKFEIKGDKKSYLSVIASNLR